MKAIVQAGNLKLVEDKNFPDPVKDGKRPIVKVEYCGICGSDVHSWEIADRTKGLVMGHEYSGIVVDPGDSTTLKVGDRVTCSPITPCGECEWCKMGRDDLCPQDYYSPGTFFKEVPGAMADYMQLGKSAYVKKLPDNMTLRAAALIEPANIGLRACQSVNVEKGDKVLVAGGGIIGVMAAQFAKYFGASYVAMTEINHARAKRALELGVVDDVFDPTEEGVADKINAKIDGGYTKGGGFTKFLECSGSAAALNFGVSYMKKAGQVSLVGVNWNPVPIMTVMVLLRQLTMVGIMSAPFNGFDTVMKAASEGKIKLEELITKEIPFEVDAVQAAFEELHDPTNEQLKILIRIGDGKTK